MLKSSFLKSFGVNKLVFSDVGVLVFIGGSCRAGDIQKIKKNSWR